MDERYLKSTYVSMDVMNCVNLRDDYYHDNIQKQQSGFLGYITELMEGS